MTIIIDRALAFRLAGAASTDWRTAERFLRGETIRGLPGARLRTAAASLGVAVPVTPYAITSAPQIFAHDRNGKVSA